MTRDLPPPEPAAWARWSLSLLLPRRGRAPAAPLSAHARDLAITTLICACAVLAAAALLNVFELENVVAIFFATVVFVALRLGRIAGIWASLICVLSFDYYFIPPRFTFEVKDLQYTFTFALVLAVALAISRLASELQDQAEAAGASAQQAAMLAQIGRECAGCASQAELEQIVQDSMQPLLATKLRLLLPDQQGGLDLARVEHSADRDAARHGFATGERAGLGSAHPPGARACALPLSANAAVRGVMLVWPPHGQDTLPEDQLPVLLGMCAVIALALERIHLNQLSQETLLRVEGERFSNTLLAAVSHDLKTPLTAIRGLAETLEHPAGLAAAQQAALAGAIRQEADELREMVTNLLDLAKSQRAGVRLNKDWHVLAEIITSAISRAGGMIERARISVALPPDLALVHVDALLIKRVLVNLLDNVARHTPPATRVFIRAAQSAQVMQLVIEDDGPGFAVADPEILFYPQRQGTMEMLGVPARSGLSLCRAIMTAHGGSISARPRQPHGAVFELLLPIAPQPEIEPEIEPEMEPGMRPGIDTETGIGTRGGAGTDTSTDIATGNETDDE